MMDRIYPAWPPAAPPIPEDASSSYVSLANPNRNNWKSQNPNEICRNEFPSHGNESRRRFAPRKKKKLSNINRFAPFAPRNTTSFLIRAKKSGGIASLVSPCPVTPMVLPTPMFSPSREVLVDMAKEEWGVDGYGSMNGIIRLRSPLGVEDEDGGFSAGMTSDSDVEERVEVERRLDHDLSRFEMVYPRGGGGLESRVDDQAASLARLEDENMVVKERLILMETELEDMRRRIVCLERGNNIGDVSENASDNDGGGDVSSEKSISDGDDDDDDDG